MNKIGIIGVGPWGSNYVRVLSRIIGIQNIIICDIDPKLINETQINYPGIEATDNYLELTNRDDVDGIIIATPPKSHFLLAKNAILAGKHVLIEKPVAESLHEVETIFEIARKIGIIVMAGHLMVYHSAVEEINRILKSGTIGQLQYIVFNRANPKPGSGQADVLWDLGVHDLSILEYWLGEEPNEIKSGVLGNKDSQTNASIFTWMRTASGVSVLLLSSCCHPVKVRQTVLVGDKYRLLFDDLESKNKIAFYSESGNPSDRTLISAENLWSEPLEKECRHFLDCISEKTLPLTGEKHTLTVMRTAESILNHLSNK